MRGIRHLCDHRGIVHRATVTKNALRETVETWVPLAAPAGLNCRPNQNWSGTLQDHGPGEQQGALRQWFLVPEFDVVGRDVLEITEGPEAGVTLRILSVTRPTDHRNVHHLEVNVEVWTGRLP